jgi:hypothetical protein
MAGIDLDRLEEIAEGLALGFYLLMFTALVMLLAGETGSGFLLLIVGSCAHIGRASLEEFVSVQRDADDAAAASALPSPAPRRDREPRGRVAPARVVRDGSAASGEGGGERESRAAEFPPRSAVGGRG